MTLIFSMGRWMAGGLFFLFTFAVLAICLALCSRQTTLGVARRLFALFLWIMGIKLTVTGQHHIDPDTPYLIMGNHQSLFDLFVIPVGLPMLFTGVEAAYHFSIPVWGYLIRKWGCIPIQRKDPVQAIQSLEIAKQTLLAGLSIVILPEGHRTLSGNLLPFKKGPFHLAKNAGADILPFGIQGLFNFHPKGSLCLHPGPVRFKIGPPIPFESVRDLSVEALQDRVCQEIEQLIR